MPIYTFGTASLDSTNIKTLTSRQQSEKWLLTVAFWIMSHNRSTLWMHHLTWDILLWRRTEWARRTAHCSGQSNIKEKNFKPCVQKATLTATWNQNTATTSSKRFCPTCNLLGTISRFHMTGSPKSPVPAASSPFQSLNISHVQITTQVNHDASIVKHDSDDICFSVYLTEQRRCGSDGYMITTQH